MQDGHLYCKDPLQQIINWQSVHNFGVVVFASIHVIVYDHERNLSNNKIPKRMTQGMTLE